MLYKVYHCGLDHIQKFDFSNGVHFGGIHSALEAALRHVSKETRKTSTIYVHECLIDLSDNNRIVEEEDLGSNESWQDYANDILLETDITVVKYVNRYEPDIHPSYYVLDPTLVKIKKVRKLRPHEAEAEVDAFLNYDY